MQATQSVQKIGKTRHRTRKTYQTKAQSIEAAENLAILKKFHRARLHSLVGNRRGQLSVDLDGQYRLIFLPDHNPIPKRPSGGWDWERINKVKIMEIADPHE